MKNNAKKFPLPTGEQWARLPERVAALEAVPKPKIFRATINQGGENPPVVSQEVENTTGATFSFGYVEPGVYSIVSSLPFFKSREKAIVNLSLAKFVIIPFYNWFSETEIRLYVYNTSMSLSNDLLADNMITIEILD